MPFYSFDHSQGRQSIGEGRKSLRKQRRETSKKRRLQLEKLVARQLLAADLMGPEEPMMAQLEMTAETKSLEAKSKAVGVEAEVANPAVDYWLLSWDDDFSPRETYGPSIIASAETTELIDGARLVRFQQPLTGSEVLEHLGLSETPEMFYALEATQLEKRLNPNDASFFLQYNVHNTGQFGGTPGQDLNLIEVWDTRRGAGSVIGIVDDGVDFGHPDLSGNYRADLSYDFNGNDTNPAPDYTTNFHGTAVAGVAAAVGNNGIGVAGVAYEADFAAIKLTAGATTDAQNAAALNYQMQNIDIYNNAWGPISNGNIGSAGQPGPLATAALQNGVTNGRGGLGSVYVWAAGNGGAGDNVNYDRYVNSRHTIAVGSVTNTGAQASYSETGASLLVVAPSNGGGVSSVFTTDINGPNGYSSNGYTQNTPNLRGEIYTGTSASAAAVSGVVALMLEANPNLTSRDVQHILVDTATRNSPADAGWFQNAAGHWVNNKFGFGAVNAGAAVAASSTWTSVGPELVWESTVKTVNLAIPDNNATGVNVTFGVPDNFQVEYVEVVTDTTHTYGGDLVMKLISPSGTTSDLSALRNFTTNFSFNDVLTTARNWEENSFGTWTLNVSDRFSADVGTLNKAAIRVYGYSIDTALPNLTVANVNVTEGDGAVANFEVVLSQASATDVTFSAYTFDGTAIAGADYTPLVNVPYVIPAGQTTVTVSVPIINDSVEEINKIFSLGLTNSVGSDPLVRGAVGTISDDDDPAFYTATPLTNIGTAGTLIQQSLNNSVLLISDVDVDDLQFAGVQGQKIGAISTPSSATAIVTVQLVDSLGNSVGSPAVSPAAGQPAVLPLTSLPASEVFALRISGSESAFVTTNLMGGAVNEAWGSDTSDGAPVVIDSSFLTLGSGRYAAVGSLVVSGGITGIKTGSSANFVDISGTGTALNLGDDGAVTVVTTAGNSLMPAGNIRISNNGMIVAGNVDSPSWNNGTIPTTAHAQFLAPYWDDMFNNNTNGNVYWQETTIGGVPAVIVQWNNREHYDLGSQTITYQAQIFGSGGTLVRYVYPDVDFQTAGYSFGASATIGYQVNTTNFSQFSRNQSVLADGDQIVYQVATDDDAYSMDLSGAVGKKIDVLLTALNGSSLAGVGMDLIAPDGTTVLASALASPSGFTPTNYNKGVLSFTVPAAGVYKVRLNATASADYSLVVTESLAFDTENNDVITNPLRALDLQTAGYGYASATGTASPDVVDYYSVSLAADDYIIVQTSTPLDGGSPTALDPSISIYSPANALLVTDDNSGVDGRNAFQYFRAPAAGVYKVAVNAISGTGAYVLEINEWVNRNPSDVALSGDTLAENAGPDFEIGTLSSTDPDPGDTFTFSLVSGSGDTDNAMFNVSGTSLRASASLNFEAQSSYSVRVRSTDQRGGFLDEVFVINVTDVNDAPADITLSPADIAENAGTDVVVGTLVTSDDDAGDSFTYAMVSGAGDDDNGVFTLDGDSIKANPSFDFETKAAYTIRVSTMDLGGLVLEKAITINVTDVNEMPTDISLSAASIAENAGANAVIGMLSTSDVDGGESFTYSLVSGPGDDDNAAFNISGDALQANASFDFEAGAAYSVLIRSTDQGGLTFDKSFVIEVTDVNEIPTDITLSSEFISENAGVDAEVGTFTTTDEDAGDSFTYALVSGAGDDDNGAFNISGDSLRANASFDFEANSSYTVRVSTMDQGGLVMEKAFVITVTNANEAPTDIDLSASTVIENAVALAAPLAIGNLTTSDVDAGDSHTYSLVSGTGSTDNALFSVGGGVLSLNSGAVVDFETQPSYSVRVRSTDAGGASIEEAFTITVENRGEVSLIQVNSGVVQRSRVTDLKVSFDSEVAIGAGAFVVTKRGVGGGNVPVTFTTELDGLGRTVATISFSGGFVSGGSLVDGNYDLRIVGSLVTDQLGLQLDGDNDGIAGGDRMFGTSAVDNFFRMFGDTSGDRNVALGEFNEFRGSYGRSSGDPLYKQVFDFEDNGTIALSDFNQFRSRYGTTLLFV